MRNKHSHMLLVYVDIDDCPSLQNKYHAPRIPTVIAFVNGREADRFVGAREQAYVEQFLANLPSLN